jgi:Mce-associated membrane protein
VTLTIRRALWWALTIVLAVFVVGVTIFGAVKLATNAQPKTNPADSQQSRQEVLDVATSSVLKLLSYNPDNVDTSLHDAVNLTTGAFRDTYTKLIEETVIPGAKQRQITATATVPAAAIESLTVESASLLVFINQSVTVPPGEPTETASSVRAGLVKQNGSWLVAQFDPL